MNKVPLTVVVLTKNEERNIDRCLKSISDWADEIIVVDDESSDRTVQIVRGYTARILTQKMENEGIHRNRAYQAAGHEWVLSLDADESLTDSLKKEIEAVLKATSFQAFAIPHKNYIGDYWVRYGGWYPNYKIKLFQKNRFRYEEVEVHPRAFVDGDTGRLSGDIIHNAYRNFEHYLEKLNRQTTLEARKWLRNGTPMHGGRAARRAVDRFFRSYIGKRGIKDGFTGFMIAYFSSMYQIVSYAKYKEFAVRNPQSMDLKEM